MGNRGPRSKLEPYDDDIRRMYVDEELTDEVIAEKLPLKTSAEAVRIRRKALEIQTNRVRKTGRYVMANRYEEVKDSLAQAWEDSKQHHPVYKRPVGSAERVGKSFGVSQATAYDWLVRAGVLLPRPSYDRGAPRAVELFEQGMSIPRIAESMDLSVDTIRGWLKRKGVDYSAHPTTRMTHEEKRAWQRSISAAKATSVAGSGRYDYHGVKLDSSYEVRFVMSCDRLGLAWRAYDREADGVLEVDIDGETVRYAPDLMVGALPVEVKGIFDRLAAAKVASWRSQRGKLAMVMRQELSDLEDAKSAEDVIAVLDAACYLTPPTDPAYWD